MHRPYSSAEAHRLLVESRSREDGVAVVRLRGEADLHTAPILRDALNEAIERARRRDRRPDGVTFIDSMMLGVLLSATRRARPKGIELRIVVDDPHVRRIFELTLLDQMMQLYPASSSRSRADAAFQAIEVMASASVAEHRDEPVERRDLEHAAGGLRRRDEHEPAAGFGDARCAGRGHAARTSRGTCSSDSSITRGRRRATGRARRRKPRPSTGRGRPRRG